jgi:hypothetical protein
MLRRTTRHLSYANVMATVAVFIALGGSAAAAFVVSSNSQIGPNTVAGAKPPSGDGPNIIAGSIFTPDLANAAITGPKLAADAVGSGKVKDGSLTGADVAADSLTGAQIDESTLGTVPSASNAAHATNADELGGVGPGGYQVAITGSCPAGSGIASFNTAGAVGCNRDSVRPGTAGLSLGPITLSSQSCVAVDDTAIVVPDAATWPAGLIYMPLRADQAGRVPLDVCNPTKASVSSPSGVHLSIWLVKITP